MSTGEKLFGMIWVFVVTAAIVTLMAVIMAYPVKWCWNYTMPYLFKLPEIGALHGFCLSFLGARFFKSTVDLKCKHDEKANG